MESSGGAETEPRASVELEAGEWYALVNWLREHENRLYYAYGPTYDEWKILRELRRSIEDGVDEAEGPFPTVSLDRWQWEELCSLLSRRRRALQLKPWRHEESRDVRNLLAHVRDQL
ncbi:hypothetical protein [Natronorarus salvus]|uniref:hypothetical protein n=1 Tax=Natronorarus salvus TaxID=3117733 RepID=UPI002F2695AE